MTNKQKQIPFHLHISEYIYQQIVDGHYSSGDKLPSEREMIKQWKVSRITIRKAIANLVNQGVVLTKQGKGAFVSNQRKVTYQLSNPLVFLADDLNNQGIELSIENISLQQVVVSKEIAQILNLPSDKLIALEQKKLLLIDGIAGCVDITYMLPEVGQGLINDLKTKMTFPVLENNDWQIDRVEAVIECTNANLELSEYLDVSLGHPLLVYRHTAYSKDNLVLVYGQSISRGDRFCYAVNQYRSSAD